MGTSRRSRSASRSSVARSSTASACTTCCPRRRSRSTSRTSTAGSCGSVPACSACSRSLPPTSSRGAATSTSSSNEHARTAYEDEQRIIATGEPLVDIEELETWPDRPDSWVSTTKLPLKDFQGRIIGTFGISREITRRVLAERGRPQPVRSPRRVPRRAAAARARAAYGARDLAGLDLVVRHRPALPLCQPGDGADHRPPERHAHRQEQPRARPPRGLPGPVGGRPAPGSRHGA